MPKPAHPRPRKPASKPLYLAVTGVTKGTPTLAYVAYWYRDVGAEMPSFDFHWWNRIVLEEDDDVGRLRKNPQ